METISIITICFNNLADVQKTCASVDTQTVHPFEHWIVNGSTNNEIANWLQTTPQPAYRKWVNEKDKGIADAFNKGIANANGSIIHLLNSGDIYATNDILQTVLNFFETNKTVQWVSGKIKIKRSSHWIEIGKPFDETQLYKGMRSVLHPTYFLRKEVYKNVGVFNLNYKIAMDYDLLCRLGKQRYQFINKTLIAFDDSGISNTNYLQSLQENIAVYESHFGYSFKCRLWQLRLKLLHHLLQTSLGKWLFTIKKNLKMENV